MLYRKVGLGLFFLFSVFLNACHPVFAPGHYEGVLLEGEQLNSEKQKRYARELVSIDVQWTPAEKHLERVDVTDVRGKKLFYFEVRASRVKKLELVFPQLTPQPLELKEIKESFKDSGIECLSHFGKYEILLCRAEQDFQFSVKDAERNPIYLLSGGKFSRGGAFTMEEPRDFRLDQAILIALNQNFSSRIEFEYLRQAQENAKTAYLHLLPHVKFSTFISIPIFMATLNPYVVVNEMGNIASFAFPNRWFQARGAKQKSLAQAEAYKIMQADITAQVESLSYTWLGQLAAAKIYESFLRACGEFLDRIGILEENDRVRVGSVDTLDTTFRGIRSRYYGSLGSANESQNALSETLGFLNSKAVKSLALTSESIRIEDAKPLNPDRVKNAAVLRSMEIRQMDYMIEYAVQSKNAMAVTWVDPQAFSTFSFGANWVPQMSSTYCDIRIAVLKQAQTQQKILHRAVDLVMKYNASILAYKEASDLLKLQEKRLSQVREKVMKKKIFSDSGKKASIRPHEIQDLFQDYLSAALVKEGYLTSFRIARAQIERLLLTGYYSHFMKQNPDQPSFLEYFEESLPSADDPTKHPALYLLSKSESTTWLKR